MAKIALKKGMDIRLSGRPGSDVVDAVDTDEVAVYPTEFHGMKPRLLVREGDKVKAGGPLALNKKQEQFHISAPAAGTVSSIEYGYRRVIERIVIKKSARQTVEKFDVYTLDDCRNAQGHEVLGQLLESGYLAFLRQRPFSRIADAEAQPKAIFVNAMSTAPFQTDIAAAIQGHEQAFQAGLYLLGNLTDGLVHLITPGDRTDLPDAITEAEGVEHHQFTGPHPAGNSSVHIHCLDPICPGDVVWTIRADDLVQIGRLFLDGRVPADRVVSLGGPGVDVPARRHYRVQVGGSLQGLFEGNLVAGETRIVNGNVLGGAPCNDHAHLPLLCQGFTVLPEDRQRRFLGWLAPGLDRLSLSPLFLSTWFRRTASWDLGTSQHGSPRAMVLTGLYDKYMPMNIMVDYLVRAVLANDTDEAIKLGILETEPEDFALCAFACPSKMDLVGVIRRGLDMIEEEGF